MDYPIKTPQQLAQVLKGIRKDRRLTQATVATRMNSLQGKISLLELHPEKASVSRLLRMLSVLGVDLILRDRDAARARQPKKAQW
jgi:HTH-type transcriptional regulator/antitoxin HipB